MISRDVTHPDAAAEQVTDRREDEDLQVTPAGVVDDAAHEGALGRRDGDDDGGGVLQRQLPDTARPCAPRPGLPDGQAPPGRVVVEERNRQVRAFGAGEHGPHQLLAATAGPDDDDPGEVIAGRSLRCVPERRHR